MSVTVVLGIEYEGTQYCGWQRQNNQKTVQDALEQALSKVADQSIEVQCAGRTDRGVHATVQVVSFETTVERAESAWQLGTNTHLPLDVRVCWVKILSDAFHARFDATKRHYTYVLYNGKQCSAFLRHLVTHFPYPLDAKAMHDAAQSLLGEQDFQSLRSSVCQSHSSFRHVSDVCVERQGDFVVMHISANAFLHHMVRNIMGVLCEIGQGRKPVTWMRALLAEKDRTQAGVTAPPEGLYLVGVDYPPEHGLPSEKIVPFFPFF